MRAVRGLRVGRDQTTIRSVLGVHVVEFPLFSSMANSFQLGAHEKDHETRSLFRGSLTDP